MRKKIKLISIQYTQDSIGDFTKTETLKEVFCDVKSISGQEFSNAGQNGIKPALVFIIWAHEYNSEDKIEYQSVEYSVYRTYVREDGRIELYTERRVE